MQRVPCFFTKNNGELFITENPQEDLVDLLIEKTISAGHALSFTEASEDPEMVQPNHYAAYFGSFEEAAQFIWNKVNPPVRSPDGLTSYGRRAAESLRNRPDRIKLINYEYRKKKGDRMKTAKKMNLRGKKPLYTYEEVKQKLIDFYQAYGRIPKQTEFTDSPYLVSYSTFAKFLGPKSGWQAIIDEAIGTSSVSAPVEDNPPEVEPPEAEPPEVEAPTVEPPAVTEELPEPEAPPADEALSAVEEPRAASLTPQIEIKDQSQTEVSDRTSDNLVNLELKITLPDREKPIFITLTV